MEDSSQEMAEFWEQNYVSGSQENFLYFKIFENLNWNYSKARILCEAPDDHAKRLVQNDYWLR